MFNSLARWILIRKYGELHGKTCKEKEEMLGEGK